MSALVSTGIIDASVVSRSSSVSRLSIAESVGFDPEQWGSVVQRIFQAVISDQQPSLPISNVAINSAKTTANSYSLFNSVFKTPSEVSEGAQAAYVLGVAASCLTTFEGVIGFYKTMGSTNIAKRVGDKKGVLEGRISLVRSGVQTVRGITYAVSRPLSHIASLNSSESVTVSLMERVSYGMGITASVLSILYSAFKVLCHGMKIHERNHFFSKVGARVDKLLYLKQRFGLEIETTKRYGELEALSDEEKVKFLIKEGMKRLKLYENELEEVKEIRKATGAFSEATLQAIFKNLCSHLPNGTQSEQMIDLYKEIVRKKKTYKMERVLGKELFSSLKAQLKAKDVDEAKVIEQLQVGLKKSNKDDAIRLAVALAILVAFVLTLVFAGPAIPFITSIIFIVTALITLAHDGYDFYKDFKAGKISKYDSLISKIGFGIGVVAITAGIIGMAVLGFNPVGLGMLITVGVIWLAVHGTMIWMAHKKNNPDPVQLKKHRFIIFRGSKVAPLEVEV